MGLKYLLPFFLMSFQAHSLQLREDSDFDWITGCEIAQEGFDYSLVYEDMVRKSNPGKYAELVNNPEFKKKTFADIQRAKDMGYLCSPIAVIKFDLELSGYNKEVSGFKVSQENIANVLMVKNQEFLNLPDTYKIELEEFSIPPDIKVVSHKVHQMLQRCPEIKAASKALLEVFFMFSRKTLGEYIGVPNNGRISAYCSLLPKRKMELVSFKYSKGKQ